MNYFVDPANIFKKGGYEKGVSEILLKGLNAANISDCDERLLQKNYIEGCKHEIDIIMLGSSRAMQVQSMLFSNKVFFNNSVSGATIEDFIAIFEIYREEKIKPKIIIFGLDPWLLNKNNCQERWKSISSYYDRFMIGLGLSKTNFSFKSLIKDEKLFRLKRYLQLFSLTYFQTSITSLFEMIKEKNLKIRHYPTDLTDLDVDIKLFDGSFAYKKEYIMRTVSEVLKSAQTHVNNNVIYSLNSFYKLDKESMFKFENFLNFLLNENIEIVFFFAPYHPYVYNYLVNSNEYKIILQVERYFKNLALQNNIYLIGSYDPKNCGFDERDFYDDMHPKREAINRLFKELINH